MSVVTLLAVILLAGIIAWLIKVAPFIDEKYRAVALWVLLAAVVLWIAYTILGPFPDMRIPTRRG